MGNLQAFDLRTGKHIQEHAVLLNGEIDVVAVGGHRIVVGGRSPNINSWRLPDTARAKGG